jgi:hypothetical protein
VEQPLKITPEVGDGDRKSIPVKRDVYEPGSGTTDGTAPGMTGEEAGIPAKASNPDRIAPMPRGAISEDEKSWLEQWLRRFGTK